MPISRLTSSPALQSTALSVSLFVRGFIYFWSYCGLAYFRLILVVTFWTYWKLWYCILLCPFSYFKRQLSLLLFGEKGGVYQFVTFTYIGVIIIKHLWAMYICTIYFYIFTQQNPTRITQISISSLNLHVYDYVWLFLKSRFKFPDWKSYYWIIR